MSDVTKGNQSTEKSQIVLLAGKSNTTLINNIRITSDDEQADVDAFLTRRCDVLMNIGYQPDWTPQERAALVNEYRRALRHLPKWVLAKAIDRSVGTCANRPTPGNIASAANSITKDITLTELAGAVGMPRSTVGSILRRKGWRIASAGASGSGRAQGVDTEIQQNWRN